MKLFIKIEIFDSKFTLYLFRWKNLCKDSFAYFPAFGSIRKNELKENHF